MKTAAFIGTGRMGSALVRAVCRTTDPSEIVICNRTISRAQKLANECGCVLSQSNSACARNAKFVILGVKPNGICPVLREIAPIITPEQTVVSMSAGVTIAQMREALGKDNPIIRILPNTPCEIGKGILLLAAPEGTEPALVQELTDLFAACGTVSYTDEAHADAGLVIEGCTPAFTYMFIEALADGAVETGLPRAQALEWAARAVAGSAELLLESGAHPGELKDAVCSPGGTTIAGVHALEEHGFRAAAMSAVTAAWRKGQGVGK